MPRPAKKPATQTRSTVLPPIRVTPSERAAFAAAAEREGSSLSEWIRTLALVAAEKR